MADQDKDLSEAKRIMGRLVNTPPQPHKPKAELKKVKSRRARVAVAKAKPDKSRT